MIYSSNTWLERVYVSFFFTFIKIVYIRKNFFQHTRPLPSFFWKEPETCSVLPLAQALKEVHANNYCPPYSATDDYWKLCFTCKSWSPWAQSLVFRVLYWCLWVGSHAKCFGNESVCWWRKTCDKTICSKRELYPQNVGLLSV